MLKRFGRVNTCHASELKYRSFGTDLAAAIDGTNARHVSYRKALRTCLAPRGTG